MALLRPRRRRLFVTGGTGFLGRHVSASPLTERWDVVAPSSAALDLRYRDSVVDTIRDWRPHAIVHTAYRGGDRAAIVDASRNVAEAATRTGARLVHVSTDAVFGGRLAPYTERDVPDPVHDYGRHKADAEREVARACPGAVLVRTSLIVGRSLMSSHELAVRDAVSGRSRTTFFTDEIRCPVLVDDLAASLVELARRDDVTGALHLGGPGALSRATLAVLTARRHGWDESKLRFGTIAESGLDRPARIVLDSSDGHALGLGVRGPEHWD